MAIPCEVPRMKYVNGVSKRFTTWLHPGRCTCGEIWPQLSGAIRPQLSPEGVRIVEISTQLIEMGGVITPFTEICGMYHTGCTQWQDVR